MFVYRLIEAERRPGAPPRGPGVHVETGRVSSVLAAQQRSMMLRLMSNVMFQKFEDTVTIKRGHGGFLESALLFQCALFFCDGLNALPHSTAAT